MGKIVKFCKTCEEGFAEKFSFCPNCASELSAFEMKPVDDAAPGKSKGSVRETPEIAKEPDIPVPGILASQQDEAPLKEAVFEPVDLLADAVNGEDKEFEIDIPDDDEIADYAAEEIQVEFDEEESASAKVATDETVEKVPEKTIIIPPVPARAADASDRISEEAVLNKSNVPHHAGFDDGYAVTVISERNSSTRNGLLLGAFTLICIGFVGVMIFSLFNNLSEIPAMNPDPHLIAYLDGEPVPIDVEKDDEKDGDGKSQGGGGGGGKKEDTPASQGVRPPMMRNPEFPPSARAERLTDPSLRIQRGIEGPIDERQRIPGRTGLPGALGVDPSDGPGDGGGIGDGRGRGAGSGDGGGLGPGSGGGMGGGPGGIGGGGTGSRQRTADRTPPRGGPSSPMQVLFKPRPGYTEAARKNNVTGSVRLRVTFNANGTIGSIASIKGLPDGLTEQAIAAARGIQFKPEMRNGQAIGVKKTVVFNFTIY